MSVRPNSWILGYFSEDDDCPGQKDCPPPSFIMIISSAVTAAILEAAGNYMFNGGIGKGVNDSGSGNSDLTSQIVGLVVFGLMFSVGYLMFARPPRPFQDQNRMTLTRILKGGIFGFVVGSIFYIPEIFLADPSVGIGALILGSVYEIAQLTVIGAVVGLIQGRN